MELNNLYEDFTNRGITTWTSTNGFDMLVELYPFPQGKVLIRKYYPRTEAKIAVARQTWDNKVHAVQQSQNIQPVQNIPTPGPQTMPISRPPPAPIQMSVPRRPQGPVTNMQTPRTQQQMKQTATIRDQTNLMQSQRYVPRTQTNTIIQSGIRHHAPAKSQPRVNQPSTRPLDAFFNQQRQHRGSPPPNPGDGDGGGQNPDQMTFGVLDYDDFDFNMNDETPIDRNRTIIVERKTEELKLSNIERMIPSFNEMEPPMKMYNFIRACQDLLADQTINKELLGIAIRNKLPVDDRQWFRNWYKMNKYDEFVEAINDRFMMTITFHEFAKHLEKFPVQDHSTAIHTARQMQRYARPLLPMLRDDQERKRAEEEMLERFRHYLNPSDARQISAEAKGKENLRTIKDLIQCIKQLEKKLRNYCPYPTANTD